MLLVILCLLCTAVTGGDEKWRRIRTEKNGPALMNLFSMETPHYYRRQEGDDNTATNSMAASLASIGILRIKKVPDTFYNPYYHRGDLVFLRTTPLPGVTEPRPNSPEERLWYNTAVITDYRECNLACSKLMTRYGQVCGYRLRFNDTWDYMYLSKFPWYFFETPITTGMFYYGEYKTFDTLCALQEANCWDHYVRGTNYDNIKGSERALWRVVHLSACPEHDEERELFWDTSYKQGSNNKYWWDESDKLLAYSNGNVYLTKPETTIWVESLGKGS